MAAGRVLNCYDTHLRDDAENIYRPVIASERRIGRAWNHAWSDENAVGFA